MTKPGMTGPNRHRRNQWRQQGTELIPRLLEPFCRGRFPIGRLVDRYSPADIGVAIRGSHLWKMCETGAETGTAK
jgi:hypothetical protein